MTGSPDFSQRLQLTQRLSALPGPQLDQVIFALKPPPGNIPAASAPPGDRVMALLTWTESEMGCGLETLEQAIDSVLAQREQAAPQSAQVFMSQPAQASDQTLTQTLHQDPQAADNTLQNGKYILERELGRGRFAISYLAKRSDGERWVIKVLNPQVLAGLNAIEKDRQETLFWQ